ncbi:MAG TPA: FAD-dependent oxidoreductase [Gaiellaceae bacterium]|nr:FAD-dependent oxidoreductase [Gaiellaceae bacterium]
MSAPLRVAVVGSGPAGFYAAGPLLAAGHEVDMIERLPTPWGLVRLGVAPDHPQLKTVSRAFEKIAAQPGFRFLGNVDVGRDLAQGDLLQLYDAVVYAFGAAADRRLGIPGEDLRGSWAATELVAWYNGHPDYQELDIDLHAERVVVVGNGNVALDVARMLALTEAELAPTDATDQAIAAIVGSGIREIVVVGRRGPVQAAWTPPELAELGEMAGADVVVDPAELDLDDASAAELEASDHIRRRNMDVLREFAARAPGGKPCRIVLRFRVSPVALLGEERVEAVELARNELVPDGRGSVRAQSTDEREALACQLVFRSVGYRGLGVSGVPFDESSGTMPNEAGRVLGEDGKPLRGVYCAGWIKRGPTGVIGTNKKDAAETVEALIADAEAGSVGGTAQSADAVDALLAERGVEAVVYQGWEAIDAAERARGEPLGRPRVKLTTWDDLLAAARLPK